MDGTILDRYFGENPEHRKEFVAGMPAFEPEACYCIRRTATGITPRKSVYVDGKRHIVSIRTIVKYLADGEYAMWTPRVSCESGCINPFHQLAVEKGIHDKQSKFTPAQRAAASFVSEFQPKIGDDAHVPLEIAEPVTAEGKHLHAAKSFAHTLSQRNDRSMAAE